MGYFLRGLTVPRQAGQLFPLYWTPTWERNARWFFFSGDLLFVCPQNSRVAPSLASFWRIWICWWHTYT